MYTSCGFNQMNGKSVKSFPNRTGLFSTDRSWYTSSLNSLILNVCSPGACEGTLACSTCHVILDQKVYNQLGPITDEENDMLDLAFGLTDTWVIHIPKHTLAGRWFCPIKGLTDKWVTRLLMHTHHIVCTLSHTHSHIEHLWTCWAWPTASPADKSHYFR